MPDEIGVFNVEAKVGLGKCGSLPAFEEFVKLIGMNGFASQTVKVEKEAVVNLQSTTAETKFVLIQPVATYDGTVWKALDPGSPDHDDLAKVLSFTNDIFKEPTAFGRILIFYDGLASSIAKSPIKLTLAATDAKFKGVKIQIITAGIIPKTASPTTRNVPTTKESVESTS